MIGFNAFLRETKIEPSKVKLVRHQDTRQRVSRTPYELWLEGNEQLELYQRIQRTERFSKADFLATFVATPLNETLFVGIYAIESVKIADQDIIDPISGKSALGMWLYELRKSHLLGEYSGRLLIDWGKGFRTWVQYAAINDKPVIEIRRDAHEPPFPGFFRFRERFSRLASVPQSWRGALSSVGGIYLLTCPRTGKQYVGSAYGDGGFWSRWESYVASGHGGNKRMMNIPEADYEISVLEVARSSAAIDDVIEMEDIWKRKLGTREFGLNGN